jgi:Icc-related predicted phosphoesterase
VKILALSDLHGEMEMLRKVRHVLPAPPGMIVFTGDIVRGKARGDEWLQTKAEGRNPDSHKEAIEAEAEEDATLYDQFFEVARQWGVPTFFVPGNMDAPRRRFFEAILRNSADDDKICCVHGLPAFASGFLISGVGGEITEETWEDFFVLQVPRWEAEYMLSFARFFPNRRILLFHTPPVGLLDLDKGNHKGSSVVNDIIRAYQPWLAFCGHAHKSQGQETIDKSVVVNPGSLKAGNYALVDSQTRQVQFHNLSD